MAQYFPKDLVSEFDKVLFDLIRVINEDSIYPKEYKFANGYSSTPEFNFKLLEKYILNFEKPPKFPSLSALESFKK